MQSLKKKLTLDSKNGMRNLVNFNLSSGKSNNLHFDVLLLSIAYNVSAKKIQKSRRMISYDIENRSKLLTKTEFLFKKLHQEFGQL